jgi:hypothetical protein
MKSDKTETIRQNDDKTWSFLHPQTNEWTGACKKRDDARTQRSLLVVRGPAKSKKSSSSKNEQSTQEEQSNGAAAKDVDNSAPVHVESAPSTSTTSDATSSNNQGDVAQQEKSVMASLSLTLDPKTRKSTSVVFKLPSGIRGSVRIAKTAFPGGVPPASLNLQSDAENAFAGAKAKLTAEERKEARKNAPKLTPAEKLAKLQERAAKLQAKIASQAAAPAGEAVAQ